MSRSHIEPDFLLCNFECVGFFLFTNIFLCCARGIALATGLTLLLQPAKSSNARLHQCLPGILHVLLPPSGDL